MPFDLAGRRKLYPDGMYGFRWNHEPGGSISANTFYELGVVECAGQPNHGQAKAQGYSCSFGDWRDVEQKIYFNSDTATSSQFLTLYQGGLGSEASPCTGYAYEALFSQGGIVRIRKKMYHIQYYDIAQVDIGALPSGLKGVAFCRFNVDGNRAVRLEAWVDKGQNGLWKRVLNVVDNGFKYGGGGARCSGSDKEAFTWGFPAVAFTSRFDYDFEDMTARVINPSGSFNEAGIGGGRKGGGGVPLPASVTG